MERFASYSKLTKLLLRLSIQKIAENVLPIEVNSQWVARSNETILRSQDLINYGDTKLGTSNNEPTVIIPDDPTVPRSETDTSPCSNFEIR